MAAPEKKIQNQCLLDFGLRQDVLLLRHHVGVFRSMDDPSRIIKVGTPGESDTIGVFALQITPEMVGKTIGVAIAPEFKAPKGRQSDPQKHWQAAFEKRGGVYVLAKSTGDVDAAIEKARAGHF
jgi:hypothetical protein